MTGENRSFFHAAYFDIPACGGRRDQEVEADRVGTELMSGAKYNPEGTVRLMKAMVKAFGARKTGYFDSHPGFEDRIAPNEGHSGHARSPHRRTVVANFYSISGGLTKPRDETGFLSR